MLFHKDVSLFLQTCHLPSPLPISLLPDTHLNTCHAPLYLSDLKNVAPWPIVLFSHSLLLLTLKWSLWVKWTPTY